MTDGNAVREQFSALQRQQKERINQLQEKSTKKKLSTVDVCLEKIFLLFFFLFMSQIFRLVFQ